MTEVKISYNNEEYTLEELLQKLSSQEEKIKELERRVYLNKYCYKSSSSYRKVSDTFDQEESNSDKVTTALGVLILINELSKKVDTIKELQIENSKLKEENAALKKKELLNKNFKLSEELRNFSSEKKIIELQEDKRELQYKIQKLEYDLTEQTQLNVYLVQLLKEKKNK